MIEALKILTEMSGPFAMVLLGVCAVLIAIAVMQMVKVTTHDANQRDIQKDQLEVEKIRLKNVLQLTDEKNGR